MFLNKLIYSVTLFEKVNESLINVLDSVRSDECISFTIVCGFFFCVCVYDFDQKESSDIKHQWCKL